MTKILMVVNEDRFFLSHRLPIALAARKAGYNVKIVAKDTGQLSEIRDYGFIADDLSIDPTGMNPAKELRTLYYLCKLFRREKPDIVHLVGMKNILWGSLAARLTHVKGVVEAISGLGGLFNGEKLGFAAKSVLSVIRLSNSRPGIKAIFQNEDDITIFLKNKAIKEDQICFIKGSGVDLDDYMFTQEPVAGPVVVIFTARMVKEKGVEDLIEAAERLKADYKGKAEFWLCGRLVTNSSAISEIFMKEHCDGEYIKWLGFRNDVKDLLKKSHIMAFPSYYREGLPKSLIEASAIGRPIITCNSVGCKDVVDDGVNGFIVEPRDVDALTNNLKILIDNKELRIRMGEQARLKAEKEFSINNVVDRHLSIYQQLS